MRLKTVVAVLCLVPFISTGCRVSQRRQSYTAVAKVMKSETVPPAGARIDPDGTVLVSATAVVSYTTEGLSNRRWMRVQYRTKEPGCSFEWVWVNATEITDRPDGEPLAIAHEASLFTDKDGRRSCATTVQEAVIVIFTLNDRLDEVTLVEVPVRVDWKLS